MPTKPKSVTIDLTPKQREKLRKLTGQDHAEILVEVAKGRTAKKPLSAKAAPRAIFKGGDRFEDTPLGVPQA